MRFFPLFFCFVLFFVVYRNTFLAGRCARFNGGIRDGPLYFQNVFRVYIHFDNEIGYRNDSFLIFRIFFFKLKASNGSSARFFSLTDQHKKNNHQWNPLRTPITGLALGEATPHRSKGAELRKRRFAYQDAEGGGANEGTICIPARRTKGDDVDFFLLFYITTSRDKTLSKQSVRSDRKTKQNKIKQPTEKPVKTWWNQVKTLLQQKHGWTEFQHGSNQMKHNETQ